MKPTAILITGSYDDLADEPGDGTNFINCDREVATHISVYLAEDHEIEPVQDFPLKPDSAKAYVDALLLASHLAEQHQVRIRDTYQKTNFQRTPAKCTSCQSTTGQACNDKGCGHLEAGNGEPEKPLRVTDAMYHAFVEATRLQGNESETVKDLIMNGLEAALDWLPPSSDPEWTERRIDNALLVQERDALRELLKDALEYEVGEIDKPAWRELQERARKILPCVDEGCPQAGSEHVCTTIAKGAPPKPDTTKYAFDTVQPGMLRTRYHELQNGNGTLTPEEIAAGWFFDDDYDGLLAHTSWLGHEKDRP